MKTIRALLCLVFASLSLHVAAADAPKPDAAAKPTESLDTAIAHGIKLLEGGEYKVFIETFATPEDIKNMEGAGGVAEVAKGFGAGEKGKNVLAIFKKIQGTKPTLAEDGKQATYALPPELKSKENISFIRIGTNWYIKN
jgi:hypothetical protein